MNRTEPVAFGLRTPQRGAEGGDSSSLLDHPRTSVVSIDPHSFISIYCDGCTEVVTVPEYCGNRFCIICGSARRRRVANRLKSLVNASVPGSGERLKMITLTIPKVQDAREGVRTLLSSFRRLRSRPLWRNSVSGGAFILEICGRPGAWHIHAHILLNALYIPVRRLSKLWAQVSPGKIVDIRLAARDRAVTYLTKYLAKASVPDGLQVVVSDALKGTRMFQPFGSWYHALPPDKKVPFKCPCCGGVSWSSQYQIDRLSRSATDGIPSPPTHSDTWRNALPPS